MSSRIPSGAVSKPARLGVTEWHGTHRCCTTAWTRANGTGGPPRATAGAEAGREPDPIHGIRGKQRSVHNNYLTLPVVFAMLANHFPGAYGRSYGWAILVGFLAIGAWIRHYFNLRHRGLNVWPIPVTAALGLFGIALVARPASAPAVSRGGPPVPFARIQAVVLKAMPLGNVTHMTQAERDLLARWLRSR